MNQMGLNDDDDDDNDDNDDDESVTMPHFDQTLMTCWNDSYLISNIQD